MRTVIVAVFCLQTFCASGQLVSEQFNIGYSGAGLSSIKRVHDVYDTDYVAPGRTLGDLLIRYRNTGDSGWQEVQSGTASVPLGSAQGISYTVGRAVPTVATSSRASSSIGPWGVRALNDQIEPEHSSDANLPFFSWGDRHGTEEWAQYDFARPQPISSAEVYWAERGGENPCKLPVSWRLQYRDGDNWKDVRVSDKYEVLPDRFNRVTFEPVTTPALRLIAQLPQEATSGIFEWRVNTSAGKQVEQVHDIEPTGTFRLDGDALLWTIAIRNQTDKPMEVGDLGILLPFNTQYVWDKTETYTKRLIRHNFIAGGGSYIFWMRTNAEGPYLVMVPQKHTGLEYFSQGNDREFTAYVHSSASRAELEAKGGHWRLPATERMLAPKGTPGDSATYEFKFRWAKDYEGVRDVIYEEGGLDVNVVPGMTVPTDLTTMFSVRTRNKIKIAPEFPDQTTIRLIGEKGKDTYLYSAKFSRLGENMLKVQYGGDQYLSLEFFVTEPLETLIKKRAQFLVTHEQWNDPKRWYDGLYSQWDMKHQVLRSPDDLDGLQSYAVACDDPALGKAPYLATKNVSFPDQKQIDSLEHYIHQYVWGGLQQTDIEPYPYAIYGIPNWKVNRDSQYDDQRGKKHIWRIYDYPHVVLLYYEMYLIARNYPGMVHELDKDGYLERAYSTAVAFFTVPMEIVKWSAYETGTYNELVIPDLIQALEENGRKDEADKLRAHWETKVKYFVNSHPYLFGSEYPFDSTGFESTHALAKYAEERLHDPQAQEFQRTVKPADADYFLEQQMKLNLACRGMEPAYYWLGSDYRASGNTSYTLSYMAQMGGWAVEDYAINFARDPIPYLRLGYASYLSSWALLNSGTPESNYGYWYSGKENDGGAGGGFEPRPWGRAWLGNKEMGRGSWWYSGEIDLGFSGALRTAATVVSDDPIFGLFAYGGDLKRDKDSIQVIPKDGLRERFYVIRGATRLQIQLDRDGFAQDQPITFDDSLRRIAFIVENRSHDSHQTVLHLQGLPAGKYEISVDRHPVSEFVIQNDASKEAGKDVAFSLKSSDSVHLSISSSR
jgi:hypothetical protein